VLARMLQWSRWTASGCMKILPQRMSLSYWKILKMARRKKDLKMEEIKLKDLKEELPLKTRILWKANKDTLVISLRLSKIGFIRKSKKKLKLKRRRPLPLLQLLRNEKTHSRIDCIHSNSNNKSIKNYWNSMKMRGVSL